MKLAPMLSAAAVALALAGGLVSAPAYAEVPKGPKNIAVMDTNKNGKIEKEEYLDFMGKEFEKTAGSKGYCTFEEVKEGFRRMAIEPNP